MLKSIVRVCWGNGKTERKRGTNCLNKQIQVMTEHAECIRKHCEGTSRTGECFCFWVSKCALMHFSKRI